MTKEMSVDRKECDLSTEFWGTLTFSSKGNVGIRRGREMVWCPGSQVRKVLKEAVGHCFQSLVVYDSVMVNT